MAKSNSVYAEHVHLPTLPPFIFVKLVHRTIATKIITHAQKSKQIILCNRAEIVTYQIVLELFSRNPTVRIGNVVLELHMDYTT